MASLKEETTGKERAFRIPLDHHKSWDGVTLAKWWLAFAALVLTVALSIWALATQRGAPLLSHGPLAEPHALWESKCQTCHVPGVPLRAGAVALSANSPTGAQRCQSCHQVADHHGFVEETDQSCAQCHQDHRGRAVDLTRVADVACTSCHADLSRLAEKLPASESSVKIVTDFPNGHPEFRSLPTDLTTGDPGRLGFSHSRHMRLGLASAPDSKKSEWFLVSDISEADQERYRQEGQRPSDRVQLACASCHQLQEATSVNATASGGGSGIFEPIKYEQHCQACHLLPLEPGSRELLPHGLTGSQVEEHLKRTFRSKWFDSSGEKVKQELARPIPGRSELLKTEVISAVEEMRKHTDAATRHLHGRCLECHTMAGEGLDVEPVNIPAVWLPLSNFDHRSHRAVGCRECHPGAYKLSTDLPLAERKRESLEVMIPTLESCTQCHAPQSGNVGGVRHDCALCHRYHKSGDSRSTNYSVQGHGGSLSIERFLKGAVGADPSP